MIMHGELYVGDILWYIVLSTSLTLAFMCFLCLCLMQMLVEMHSCEELF